MNKGRVKKFLDELGVPELQRAEIFAETRALSRQASMRAPFRLLMSIVVSVMVFSIITVLTSEMLPDAVRGLSMLCGALAVVSFLWLRGRISACIWLQTHRSLLIQPLRSRGFRYCANCLYNLRGVPLETEYCPECSVFITKRDVPIETPVPIHIVHPSTIDKQQKMIIQGVTLTPQQQEQVLAIMYPQRKRKGELSWVYIFPLLAIFAGFVWLRRHMTLLPSYGILVALLFVVVFVFFLTKSLAHVRRYPKRFRTATRQIGIEVCMACGQYLGELDASRTACSQSQSSREPMR